MTLLDKINSKIIAIGITPVSIKEQKSEHNSILHLQSYTKNKLECLNWYFCP